MKIVIALFCLAVCVAAAPDCDPNAQGKPDCTGVAVGTKFRNNWDPTHYFVCNGGGEPESVLCPPKPKETPDSPEITTGYYPITKSCVPWRDWDWVPVCPKAE